MKKLITYIVNVSTPNAEYADMTRHFPSEEAARRWIETLPEEWRVTRFFKRKMTIEDFDYVAGS